MTNKLFITADEIAETLGVSVPSAYKLMKKLNNELKDKGFYVISGKLNRKYFAEKCLYGETEVY
ncbi:MAG: helix-turn-helix domain-containing protein [Clostridiales bacterium]|nr:helix-turn-helix domain-containing protein [Clostridiales bacterium]